MRSLERARRGYRLSFPSDWRVTGLVQATGFASGADCESVEVIDFAPPEGSGPTAVRLHSFVQVCSLQTMDAATLEEFMRRTYGAGWMAQFAAIDLSGVPAFQATTGPRASTIFVQTRSRRLQIVTGVVAASDRRAQRLSQVREILRSVSFVE